MQSRACACAEHCVGHHRVTEGHSTRMGHHRGQVWISALVWGVGAAPEALFDLKTLSMNHRLVMRQNIADS